MNGKEAERAARRRSQMRRTACGVLNNTLTSDEYGVMK